jgi:hypothetical protein
VTACGARGRGGWPVEGSHESAGASGWSKTNGHWDAQRGPPLRTRHNRGGVPHLRRGGRGGGGRPGEGHCEAGRGRGPLALCELMGGPMIVGPMKTFHDGPRDPSGSACDCRVKLVGGVGGVSRRVWGRAAHMEELLRKPIPNFERYQNGGYSGERILPPSLSRRSCLAGFI